MPAADVDAGMRRRDHRDGDAYVLAFAQDFVGIEQPERETKQRRIGTQGDVALIPRQADADDILAVVLAARDDTDVTHGRRVGARRRTRQGEARNILTGRQARQVVRHLFLGAVLLNQLTWPQRIWHHDDGDNVRGARGDLANDQRLRLGRESKAAMLLGDEHPEEAVLLDVVPDVLGNLRLGMAHLPIVDHAAKLFRRTTEEGLLFGRQHNGCDGSQLVPVRRSRKQLRVETDGARLQCLALCVGDLGHHALDELEYRCDQHGTADCRHGQQAEDDCNKPEKVADEAGRGIAHGAAHP